MLVNRFPFQTEAKINHPTQRLANQWSLDAVTIKVAIRGRIFTGQHIYQFQDNIIKLLKITIINFSHFKQYEINFKNGS